MKIGVLARAEGVRGIGIQSWEMAQHLDPAKTLVVNVGAVHEQYPLDLLDRFPRATVVDMEPDGRLPERIVRRWLHGLDMAIFVETPYDWRLCDWAREQSVRTVCQLNPEFYRHGLHRMPHPDGWWAPTTWRLPYLPPGTRVVPVPVATERFTPVGKRQLGPVRFLHPIGKFAAYDRNGTEAFVRACYLASRTQRFDATITCLHALPQEVTPGGDWVTVRVGAVDNYWDAYRGFDVVVLPRRYGGLSLTCQEAMAAGLPVVMPDIPPNTDWPVVPVPARLGGRAPMPTGMVPLAEIAPDQLAGVMDRLATDPRELADRRDRGLAWAETHSWEKLLPLYMDEFARVLDDPQPPPPRSVEHDPFASRPVAGRVEPANPARR